MRNPYLLSCVGAFAREYVKETGTLPSAWHCRHRPTDVAVPGVNGAGTSGTDWCAVVVPEVMLACEWQVVQSTWAVSVGTTWQLEQEKVTTSPLGRTTVAPIGCFAAESTGKNGWVNDAPLPWALPPSGWHCRQAPALLGPAGSWMAIPIPAWFVTTRSFASPWQESQLRCAKSTCGSLNPVSVACDTWHVSQAAKCGPLAMAKVVPGKSDG